MGVVEGGQVQGCSRCEFVNDEVNWDEAGNCANPTTGGCAEGTGNPDASVILGMLELVQEALDAGAVKEPEVGSIGHDGHDTGSV